MGNCYIVRTVHAGVFFGQLRSRDGSEAVLDGCRRVWKWEGANTCSELAAHGLDPLRSRVSVPVDGHIVLGVIELLPCSEGSIASFLRSEWCE